MKIGRVPGIGMRHVVGEHGLHLPAAGIVARDLLNDLHELEQPFILVLDDFHCITAGSAVNDLMSEVLSHPPEAMRLVLLTWRDPALPIAALQGALDIITGPPSNARPDGQ